MSSDKMKWFREARFGMFIHWGIYAVPAQGEWGMYYKDWDYEYYEKFAQYFNPVNFDPAAWAELAWKAGMRYVVFTTKHHDGFCMFDSSNTDFKITNTPYGKDVTAELVEAFRKRGLKIGLYHSLVDWRHPHFVPDDEHPLGKTGRSFPDRDMSKYRPYLYEQVRQLLTGYGKIDLLFFDYTSKHKKPEDWEADRLLEMVYSLQPEIIVNDRLSYAKTPRFYGDYATPEICLPNAQVTVAGRPCDWETCMTMNNNWGYAAEDKEFKDPATIARTVVQCVSMGGNCLLNVGPDARGQLPPESTAILERIGEWMGDNAEAVHGAGPADFKPPAACCYTAKDGGLYLHMLNPPMGDIILPQLNGKIDRITFLGDGSDVPTITHWGHELLASDEIRIRPPKHLARKMPAVLKITLK